MAPINPPWAPTNPPTRPPSPPLVTRSAMTLYNQKNSPLFRLPPELRNKIYAYIAHSSASDANRTSGRILRSVCRQTRAEATPFIRTSKILRVRARDSWDAFRVLRRWALGDAASYHTIEIPIALVLEMRDEIESARCEEVDGRWCHPFAGLAERFSGVREVVVVCGRVGGGEMTGEEVERLRDAVDVMFGGVGPGTEEG